MTLLEAAKDLFKDGGPSTVVTLHDLAVLKLVCEETERRQAECDHVREFVLYDGNHIDPNFCFKCGKDLPQPEGSRGS